MSRADEYLLSDIGVALLYFIILLDTGSQLYQERRNSSLRFIKKITSIIIKAPAVKNTILFLAICLSVQLKAQEASPLTFTIHLDRTVQPIRNFGASGCWFTEEIGTRWPDADRKRIAELLFSKAMDENGQPRGIGLSAFRYNIGAGTAEQGDSGGIQLPAHRVECFLSLNGTYDWSKQAGYTWMLQQARGYGVQDLIAFVNSPPVQFTKNGLGYKTTKDSSTNLRNDKYEAYAAFLSEVIKHFDKSGLHFNYISPVNEPQWDWTGSRGTAKQEGSSWTNEEIYKAAKALNNSLTAQKISTKILLSEAGMLNHLYASNLVNRSRQIDAFWNPGSPYYVGNLSSATKFVEGHGYFTDNGNAYTINTRKSVRDSLKKYNGLEYWQSEYSMLGNGYKEGKTGPISQIDYALFLAKIIHTDLTAGNATGWHYWNSYEPGTATSPRYYLIAINPRRDMHPDTLYTITKNLWALGQYSLFVRPGMKRVETSRSDNMADTLAASHVMITSFKDTNGKKLVAILINYTTDDKTARLVLDGMAALKNWRVVSYCTSAKDDDNMKPYPVNAEASANAKGTLVQLPSRSITTFVFSL